ncbi:hypothetical protein [Flagellimonas pacifica]|uniref:Uncharacterized protein n=1 Tax=Flagellimonas pacifica TaxID=1247520 RepID=A0A285MY23_9FLAO|nr:hypothetical protein [Allomuricauda parva]SNZ01447.1 hypothetical protein SAMN06265377_3286 [Allomuricauda parva]
MTTLKTIFAIIGIAYSLYVLIGFTLDVTSFDETKGGYHAPYTGWTGIPVDWDGMDKTSIGLVKRGHIIDVHIHGTTGMMTFEVLGLRYDWQTPSDRALIVHQPKEALIRRGFKPEF